MPTADASVTSPKAGRYLAQLCKHFAHKVAVEWDPTAGHVDFGMGTCDMRLEEDVLILSCASPTPEGLARVKYIVEDHVVRFGWKEQLAVDWTSGDADAAAAPD